MDTGVTSARFGRGLKRVEDNRLTTGQGRYTGNIQMPGLAHLVLLRSPHAHADIRGIDSAAAKAAPGVIAIFTAADIAAAGIAPLGAMPGFTRADGTPAAGPPRVLLASGRVRHVGEPVAAIVAETVAAGLDAAELIAVDYDILPAVADMNAAIAPGAAVLTEAAPDNIAAEVTHGDKQAVDAIFAAAAHVVAIDVVNQRLVANPMERRVAVASIEEGTGRVVFHNPSQAPTLAQGMLAGEILHEAPERVRVVAGDIGGGFGMKSTVHVEEALAAFAAKALGRAVKYQAERAEDFLGSVHGRDHITHAELALDADGKMLALRADTLANMGAYLTPVGIVIPAMLGPKVMPGTYALPAIYVRVRAVLTNTMSTAAYRGAGRPEGIFVTERLMDEAAVALGLDRGEIRRRNLIQPDAFPYKTAMGEVYDSGNFPYFLDRALANADWAGFEARRAEAKARGKLRGQAVTSYIEWTGAYQFTESVDVSVQADGRVIVHSATQAMGQGLETAYTQLLAEKLGIDPASITVIQGDTDLVHGPGSYGSRSAYVGGSAVAHGADTWVRTATPLAAEALEAASADIEFAEGKFSIVGTDRGIDLFALAGRQPDKRIAISAVHTVENSSWPNGAHVAEVEIDPDTGDLAILRYTTVDDVGRALNPMLVEGQIQGGIGQGAGQAYAEACLYEPESGQLLTGSFMDYRMPRAADLPDLSITIDQSVPCRTNPLGVKGCGESGTVAATPTIVNAIIDALRPLGIADIPMPATPFAIWRAIEAARGRAA